MHGYSDIPRPRDRRAPPNHFHETAIQKAAREAGIRKWASSLTVRNSFPPTSFTAAPSASKVPSIAHPQPLQTHLDAPLCG